MIQNNSEKLTEALDLCLANLEAGMTMEETLEKVPGHKEEIRPLLATAVAALQYAETGIPAIIQHRSRTRLLAKAELIRIDNNISQSKRTPWLRFALQSVMFLVVIAVSMTSLIATSAKTVPGDNLYRIKRFGEDTRLSIASAPARTQLESAYRARRIDEIKELLMIRRAAPIIFEGVVTEQKPDLWVIGGFDVIITPNTRLNGDISIGMFVEVEGKTTTDGEIHATVIYLRSYAFLGRLEEILGQIWIVDGIPVLLTEETQFAPGLNIGSQIVILAQVDNEGTISARAVLHADSSPGNSDLTTPDGLILETGTPIPSATPTPSPTEDSVGIMETADADEDDSGAEDGESSDEPNEPDKTEVPDEDETPEPTETEDVPTSGSGSSTNTPEPTDTDATETEEPDETKTAEPTETDEPTETAEPTKTPDD